MLAVSQNMPGFDQPPFYNGDVAGFDYRTEVYTRQETPPVGIEWEAFCYVLMGSGGHTCWWTWTESTEQAFEPGIKVHR
jgi:hypothetical protein